MSKKKIISLCLVVCLVATAIVGGTLAYFTDTDYNKNVMVTGNVKIDQIEEQYAEDGTTIEEFVDDKQLFPVTKDIDSATWDDPNAVDKMVRVENTGTENAFVRTIFAFEMGKDGDEWKDIVGSHVHYMYDTNDDGSKLEWPMINGEYVTVDVDDTEYIVGVYYYNDDSVVEDGVTKMSALKGKKDGVVTTSDYSLLKVWLLSSVGNDFYDLVGDKYDILVMSQAVQTEGFDDAATALNAAYGEVNNESVAEWFANSDYTTSHDVSADK